MSLLKLSCSGKSLIRSCVKRKARRSNLELNMVYLFLLVVTLAGVHDQFPRLCRESQLNREKKRLAITNSKRQNKTITNAHEIRLLGKLYLYFLLIRHKPDYCKLLKHFTKSFVFFL